MKVISENLIMGLGKKINLQILIHIIDYPDEDITIKKIAEKLNIDRSMAFRYLEKLKDTGYLEFDYQMQKSSPPKAIKVYQLKDEIKNNEKLIDLIKSIELSE